MKYTIYFFTLIGLVMLTACGAKQVVVTLEAECQWVRGPFTIEFLKKKNWDQVEKIPGSKASTDKIIILPGKGDYKQVNGKHQNIIRQDTIPAGYVGTLEVIEENLNNVYAPLVLRKTDETTAFEIQTDGTKKEVTVQVQLDYELKFFKSKLPTVNLLKRDDVSDGTLLAFKKRKGVISSDGYLRYSNGQYLIRKSGGFGKDSIIARTNQIPPKITGRYQLRPLRFDEIDFDTQDEYSFQADNGLARLSDGRYAIKDYQDDTIIIVRKEQLNVFLKELEFCEIPDGIKFKNNGF